MQTDPSHRPGLTPAVAALLGDARRLGMLQVIAENGPLTGAEVGGQFGLSAAAALHHLHLMREHGWLQASTRPVPRSGVHELVWSATPGVSPRQLLDELNALPGQLQPPA